MTGEPIRFITFEGGEGGGKSTQARRLAEAILSTGNAVTVTREPGGSPLAERIRGFLLDPARPALDARTEALLFAAARSDHVSKVIAPAMAKGGFVVCDRFADSTYAYQGQAAGEAYLGELHEESVGLFRPGLTILLDLEPAVGLARAAARRGDSGADRFEREDISFHRALRSRYLDLAALEPARFAVVDASVDPDSVARAVLAAVLSRYPSARPRLT